MASIYVENEGEGQAIWHKIGVNGLTPYKKIVFNFRLSPGGVPANEIYVRYQIHLSGGKIIAPSAKLLSRIGGSITEYVPNEISSVLIKSWKESNRENRNSVNRRQTRLGVTAVLR
jgi:hypothetical protein